MWHTLFEVGLLEHEADRPKSIGQRLEHHVGRQNTGQSAVLGKVLLEIGKTFFALNIKTDNMQLFDRRMPKNIRSGGNIWLVNI